MTRAPRPKEKHTLRLFTIRGDGVPIRDPEKAAEPWYFSNKMVAKAHKPDVTYTIGYGPDHHRSKRC